MRKFITLLSIFACCQQVAYSQTSAGDLQNKVKFSGGAQFWMRYTDLNPGSTIQGTPKSEAWDLSIRRIRFAVTGQPTEKWYFKIQVGTNNINHLRPEAVLNILDVDATYTIDDKIQIGGGKTGFTGLSRFSAPSTMTQVGHDFSIHTAPTVNVSDDFLRKMSVYVKGQIGPIDYRAVLSKPLVIEKETQVSSSSNFQQGAPSLQRSAYVKFQFFDKESNRSAFSPGTYYGAKKIFNIGVGAQLQREAFWNQNASNDTIYHDMFLWALDAYLDMPLNSENSKSVSIYSGYFNYDFGPNYIRNIGANNAANGSDNTSFNGTGNSFPTIGTGTVFYSQLGVRFATPKFIEGVQAIQPYGSVMLADYERLVDRVVVYDLGFSLLFNGHASKFTAGYQNRPIYVEELGGVIETDRKAMVVLQYQVKF